MADGGELHQLSSLAYLLRSYHVNVIIPSVLYDLEFIPGSAGMAPDLPESAGCAPFAAAPPLRCPLGSG